MPEPKSKKVFETGLAIDVSPYLFEKNGQKYLPWSRALELVKLNWADAKITKCGFETTKVISTLLAESQDGKSYENTVVKVEMPYCTDGRTCYVMTKFEIPSQGIEESCTLPVMDFKNQCISADKITMSDVNKAQQRCMAKNIAMATGIGLSLWHKEEMSELAKDQKIIDNLEKGGLKETTISKFKALITKGFDRTKLVEWLQTNFGTTNPRTIESEEILNRLSEELDKLDIKDFQTEKKTTKN